MFKTPVDDYRGSDILLSNNLLGIVTMHSGDPKKVSPAVIGGVDRWFLSEIGHPITKVGTQLPSCRGYPLQ